MASVFGHYPSGSYLSQKQLSDYYTQLMSLQTQPGYLGQMSGLLAGLQAPSAPAAPQEPPGRTLLIVGDYKVKHQSDRVALYHRVADLVCSWFGTKPTRGAVASAIRFHRASLPRTNARDEMGNLLGVRFFALTDDWHIQSPMQLTVWESCTLTAAHWEESEALRGGLGIHAAWPARGGLIQPRIDFEEKTPLVVATVRGYGRFVAGKEGWRAEKVIVDTLYLPPETLGRWRVVKRLRRLYPEITLEEEPWTLERSSKSAK